MGGTVPIGYDRHVDGASRSLAINTAEAATVRTLFQLYDVHGGLSRVAACAQEQGLRSKPRKGHPGLPFSRGAIHKLLTNPLYLGKITHKDRVYEGRHAPIIDAALWDRVQSKLQAASAKRRGCTQRADEPAWLKGKCSDETGDHLTPSHTRKNGRIIRYYLSNRLLKGKDPKGWRLPAKALEAALQEALLGWLGSDKTVIALSEGVPVCDIAPLRHTLTGFTASVANNDRTALVQLRTLLNHAQISQGQMRLQIDPAALAAVLGNDIPDTAVDHLTFTCPFACKRRGVETKLMIGKHQPDPDRTLQRTLAKAHLWVQAIKDGASVTDLAEANKTSGSYIRTRLVLATLSPKIQKAIMDGTQPQDLTTSKLLRLKLPLDWGAQEQMLGLQTSGADCPV